MGLEKEVQGVCNNSSAEKGVVFEARGVFESIAYNRLMRNTPMTEKLVCST